MELFLEGVHITSGILLYESIEAMFSKSETLSEYGLWKYGGGIRDSHTIKGVTGREF